MTKRILALLIVLVMLLTLAACGGEKRIVHCDHCGCEVKIDADSNMEEDWIIYCGPCNQELFGGTLVEKSE